MEDLDKIRQKIDIIDDEMMRLLSLRFGLMPEIARLKAKSKMEITQPEREAEMKLRRRGLTDKYQIDKEFAEEIFELIMKESKRIQSQTIKSN